MIIWQAVKVCLAFRSYSVEGRAETIASTPNPQKTQRKIAMKTLKSCLKLLTAAVLAGAGLADSASAAPGTTINVNFALTDAGDAMNGTPFISGTYQQAPAYYPGTTWNDHVGPTIVATATEPSSSFTQVNALDSTGAPTTIGYTTASTTTPFDLEGPYTFADHPNTKMLNGGVRRVYNSGSGNALQNRLTISGLDPLKVYTIYLASSQNPNVKCSWRIGALGTDQLIRNTTATRTSETWKPGDNWTAFYAVAPDASGNIDVRGKGDAGGDGGAFSGLTLNGFQVIEATGWLNPDKAIYDFGDPANNPGTSSVISDHNTGNNITWTVYYSANLAALSPTFTLANSATCSPVSGSTQDFSGGPVNYTVTAQDGTTRVYAVTAVKAPPSAAADMLTFSAGAAAAVISGTNVALYVPAGTPVNALAPTITASPYATVSPASGVVQDFTNPVSYTVTAENGTTTKNYTVTAVPTYYWITAGNGNWSDGPGTNWNPAESPTSAASTALVFNAAGTYTSTNDLGDGFQLNQLNLGAAVTLAGNSLNFTNNGAMLPVINQNSGSAVTISNDLDLGSNMTFGGAGGGQVNLTGLLTGAGSLTKNGSGTLEITSLKNRTYTGGTIINSGRLYLYDVQNFQGLGTGPVTLNGGVFHLDRFTLTNDVIVNGGSLTMDNGFGSSITGPITLNVPILNITAWYNNHPLSGAISGSGGITLASVAGGGVILSDVNNYTGPTTVTGGTLTFNIAADQTLSGNISGLGNLAKVGAGTLMITGVATYTGTTTLTGGTLAFNNAAAQTLPGVISGAGALTQAGPGSLTLPNVNSYTGQTTVSGGKLIVTGSTTAGSAVSVASGATLGGTGTINGDVTLDPGAMLSLSSSAQLTLKTVNLNNNVVHLNLPTGLVDGVYTLATYVSATSTGTLAAIPVIDSGSLAIPGTDMLVAAANGIVTLTVGNPPITITPATIPNGTTIAPYRQALSAAGGFGAPYQNYTVASGALPDGLSLSLDGVISGTPNTLGNFTFAVQVQDQFGFPAEVSKSYTMSIVLLDTFSWGAAVSGDWSDASMWSPNGGVIAAPAAAGQANYVLNFNPAGAYTATQNLNDGFLLNALNFAGAATLAGANGLVLTNNDATLPTINQNSTIAATISTPLSLAADVTVGGTGSGQVTLTGLLSGAGSLTKNGSGTLAIYNVTNSFTGGTTINSGTLRMDIDAKLGTGPITLNGGTLYMWRFHPANALTVNGGTLLSENGFGNSWDGPITLNVDFNCNVFYTLICTGAISGPGGVIKTGNGPMTLSGINSYTGATVVTAGELKCDKIDSLGSGALSISAGGAKVNLNFTGTSPITSLTLGGVAMTASGTYGSAASGADFQSAFFVGTGTVAFLQDTFRWEGANGANWSVAENWNNLVPVAGKTAVLSDSGSAGATVNLDTDVTVGGLTFNNLVANQTIASTSGKTLTLASGSLVKVNAGSHAISANVNGIADVMKSGPGALILAGTTNAVAGSFKTDGGTTTLASGATLAVSGEQFTVRNGSTMIVSGTVNSTTWSTVGMDAPGTTESTMILKDSAKFNDINGYLVIGDSNANNGRLIIQDSAELNASLLILGQYGGAPKGYVSQNGGAVNLTHANGQLWYNSAALQIGSGAALVGWTNGQGEYRLNGGTLKTHSIGGGGAGTGKFFFNGGTLKPSVSDAAVATALAGTGQTVFMQSLTQVVVEQNGAIIDTNNQSITINQSLEAGAGNGGLTKQGLGTLTLLGTNTYTGTTTVSGGILVVSGTSINDAGKLVINSGAKVQVGDVTEETVNTLFFGATAQAAGTYSATAAPGVDFVDTVNFAGTGIVRVLALGVATPYETWAAGFLPANVSDPAADTDRDGMSNQQEYAFGLNPTLGSSVSPITSGLTTGGMFTYTRRNPALTGLGYTVWTSPDLQTWTQDTSASQTPDSQIAEVQSVSVTITATPLSGKLFVRVAAAP